jgi:hypothetical protein
MNRIANEGPVLAESCLAEAVVRKLPDDPMCLRASLGGSAAEGYYVVYRGSESDVERLLVAALEAFRTHVALLAPREVQ